MTGVLTVVAKIHPKVGREAEVEALLVNMATAVRQHEPDCLSTGRIDPPMSRRCSISTNGTARTPPSSSTGPPHISPGTGAR